MRPAGWPPRSRRRAAGRSRSTGAGSTSRSSSAACQEQVRAGHDDQPDGDAEGVVLDAAGLDLAQSATGVDGAGADGVYRPVDDLAVEPPDGRRELAADDHEQ